MPQTERLCRSWSLILYEEELINLEPANEDCKQQRVYKAVEINNLSVKGSVGYLIIQSVIIIFYFNLK